MNDMELTLEIARTLDDKRALDLVALDVRHLTKPTFFMTLPRVRLLILRAISSAL